MVLEIPVEGRTIKGNILEGKLFLASFSDFQVLTPDGKKSFQMDLKSNQSVVTSEDGNFFGITTYSKNAPPGFLSAKRFELYSSAGNKLWEIQDPEVSDFRISNGGMVVGISGGEGNPESDLAFYDPNGGLLFKTKIRYPQAISFSRNGQYVLVNSAKDGLMIFDRSGNLKFNMGLCQKFSISPDGAHVATVASGDLKFYYEGKPTGKEIKVASLVREICFSPEGEYLCAIDKKNLYLFEVKTGKLLWQRVLKKAGLSFISVDVAHDAEKIIAGVDFDKGRKVPPEDRHTQGYVYLFDKSGKLTWERKLSYKLWNAFVPEVKFSQAGSEFSVKTRERIYLFELKQLPNESRKP